jgi:hypothetical protein
MSDPHQNRESQKYDNPIPSREYEMVLLVGHVPNMHVQVLSESDFNDEQLPLI